MVSNGNCAGAAIRLPMLSCLTSASSVFVQPGFLEHLPKRGEALVALGYAAYGAVFFDHDVGWEDANLKRAGHLILVGQNNRIGVRMFFQVFLDYRALFAV